MLRVGGTAQVLSKIEFGDPSAAEGVEDGSDHITRTNALLIFSPFQRQRKSQEPRSFYGA